MTQIQQQRLETLETGDAARSTSCSGSGASIGLPVSSVEGAVKMFKANDKDALAAHMFTNSAGASSIMAIDVGQVERQVAKWDRHMPRVRPFYACKSLPDVEVLSTLARCGTGFDCASKSEIEAVRALGVESERIIFANPCKFPKDIQLAAKEQVRKMTFDSADELEKIAELFPKAQLVLRIVTDDSASVCRLSNKYGAAIEDCDHLLATAKELCLDVIGVSFHVGSGASDPSAFVDALRNARKVFDMAPKYQFDFSLLDIGGGFPGDDEVIDFAEIGRVIHEELDHLFPDVANIIAEPGRFFSHSSAMLATQVIARRVMRTKTEDDPDVLYYVADGVYGSFNCILFDHYKPAPPLPYDANGAQISVVDANAQVPSHVFGPTCDGLDTLYENLPLPKLKMGDWLVFKNMGAYTIAAASTFNGIEKPTIVYVCTQ